MISTIHELRPLIPVTTPHGEGLAYLVIDYGSGGNTMILVTLDETGMTERYNIMSVKFKRNWTVGRINSIDYI